MFEDDDDLEDAELFSEVYGTTIVDPDEEFYTQEDLMDDLVAALEKHPEERDVLEDWLKKVQEVQSDEELWAIDAAFCDWCFSKGGLVD